MIGSVERYSPAAGKRRAGPLGGRLLRVVLIGLLLYLVVSRFIAGSYRIESVSMEPSLLPAQRVIVSLIAYGPRVPYSLARLPGMGLPQRGDLVVVQPPFVSDASLVLKIAEPVASFFSLQKLTLFRDPFGSPVTSYMVKRVVGLPGDTIRISHFSVSVRPRGGTDFVPEQQMVPVTYTVQGSMPARGWSEQLPLSGTRNGDLLLDDQQYFVLGDNRPSSSDSRSWGPVRLERIVGKVVYRYWPPAAIGIP
ncbi:MAG TPA: signal peptidase I [Spirochaetia bacterium]|nr:signal peptidase I [Spirochaetia bacterium]